MISADGRALSGPKTVDELSITGAPILVAKQAGSPVFAGTILGNGTLELTAEKTSEDTAFGKIVERVEEAQDSKAPTERFIDRFSKRYTPAVLAIAVLVWFVTRNTELVITILVLGCPGTFVIGVPVSNVASIGNGARHDILFKGSDTVTRFSQVDTVLFDKTGVLTYGASQFVRELLFGDSEDSEDRESAGALLASVERESGHPFAHAFAGCLEDLPPLEVEAMDAIWGQGIASQVVGHEVLAEKPPPCGALGHCACR